MEKRLTAGAKALQRKRKMTAKAARETQPHQAAIFGRLRQYFSSFAKGAPLPRCHLAPVESVQPS